jgi:hypothetical protein
LAIQQAVSTAGASSYTPVEPPIIAAHEYFTRNKPEDEGLATPSDYYVESNCQPKFLINIADEIGNCSSSVASTHVPKHL